MQAGVTNEVEHNHAKEILLEMGEFFQIQVRIPLLIIIVISDWNVKLLLIMVKNTEFVGLCDSPVCQVGYLTLKSE